MNFISKILICLFFLGINLYCYIDKTNKQAKMRLELPIIEKKIEALAQENAQLEYQLENFKNPQHLLELAQRPEYSHLKFPYREDILVISSEIAQKVELSKEDEPYQALSLPKPRWPVYLGSKK